MPLEDLLLAQHAILGNLIRHPREAGHKMLNMSDEWFDPGAPRRVFGAIWDLVSTGVEPDRVTVADRLPSDINFIATVGDLAESENVGYYTKQLRQGHTRKCMTAHAKDLSGRLESGADPSEAVTEFLSATQDLTSQRRTDLRSQLASLKNEIERNYNHPHTLFGLDTGLARLNELTEGMRRKELWALGALTSIGKSALAHYVSYGLASQGEPVLLISTEMSAELVLSRLAAMASGINTGNILRPAGQRQFGEIGAILDRFADLPLEVEDSLSRLSQIQMRIRMDVLRRQTKLVVVDYIQQISVDNESESRYLIVQRVVESLKALAMELDIAILVLAQLNDDAQSRVDSGKAPSLTTLRESRSIAHCADVVLILERRRDGGGNLENVGALWISKQRSGATGKIPVRFHPGIYSFEEI